VFTDRYQAGKLLARKLHFLKGKDAILLAIPRGGVVVGKAMAKKLDLPLDIVVTRKLGAPHQPELAIGAVGPDHTIVLNRELINELGVDSEYLEDEIRRQERVLQERITKYRGDRSEPDLAGKAVILVDDGIATGATVEAAIKYLRTKEPKEIILAVPVAPKSTIEEFEKLVDKMVVLLAPEDFRAVGDYYESFPQVTDEEVINRVR
jgi:predicted phosphoribosyltransferase